MANKPCRQRTDKAFRRELPKTATGKIQRFKLRAEADAP